jgi:hypothetical protein
MRNARTMIHRQEHLLELGHVHAELELAPAHADEGPAHADDVEPGYDHAYEGPELLRPA